MNRHTSNVEVMIMESEIPMFCFQCEQTAGGKGCTGKAGVCGKTREVSDLQDRLTGALVSLASSKRCDTLGPDGDLAVMKALFATLTNVDFDADDIAAQTSRIQGMSGGAAPYDMASVWNAQEDVRSLKSLILFGIRGMAAYAYHAAVLGRTDGSVMGTVYRGLRAIGSDAGADELLAMVMEVGRSNLVCMEMLDSANREAFGIPAPVKVSTEIEAGPAIIVTGHDLRDLKALLEQTEGKGINVYTHGEMLPAHAYSELSKYGHLKGHYGTAWQNQRTEFDGIDVPVLFTTNCLMPPKDSYIGNVFTSGPVCHPGTVHIDGEDFTPVIERALQLGGFKEGVAGKVEYTTGFGREAVLSDAGAIVDGVRSGATLQRPGPGRHRRNPAPPGHGPVQRRLRRHKGRAGSRRRVRLRRQRPAAVHGPVLVRAEGRVHPAHAPPPRGPGHIPRTLSPGIRLARGPERAGGELRHTPDLQPGRRPRGDPRKGVRPFPPKPGGATPHRHLWKSSEIFDFRRKTIPTLRFGS